MNTEKKTVSTETMKDYLSSREGHSHKYEELNSLETKKLEIAS